MSDNRALDGQLVAAAPTSAYLAVITLVLSGVALTLFFGGVHYVFGPINDVLVAATLFLLIPPALALRQVTDDRAGAWFTVVTWLAIAGMVEAAAGQLLLVAGVIDLQTSFVTGGIGIVPVLVWIGAVSYLAVGNGVVDRQVGWWGNGFLVTSLVATVGIPVLPQPVLYALGVPIAITAVGFIWSLGSSLRRRRRSSLG